MSGVREHVATTRHHAGRERQQIEQEQARIPVDGLDGYWLLPGQGRDAWFITTTSGEQVSQIQRQQVQSARGYLSQSELTLTFGLGKATQVDHVVVEWPGKRGFKQEFSKLVINKVHHLKQGEEKTVRK